MRKQKHIHFVGIKGVGMTPLAIIAKEAGMHVTGSDLAEEFITDEPLRNAGIEILDGFDARHIDNADLVITTGAHGGYDNVEVQAAKIKHIPILTQGEALGSFMSGEFFGKKFIGIAVSGSHGKTTTTAMIATILSKSGLDPSYVIGTSAVDSLGLPGHFGKGKFFVVEADEYATEPTYDKTPKFHHLHPKIAVITNIELDHPDMYPTEQAIQQAFRTFVNNLPDGSVLIANGDDPLVRGIIKEVRGRVVTFGFSPANMYVIKRTTVSGSQTFFWLEMDGTTIGEFGVQVSGEHNAMNATSAIVCAIETGLSIEKIKQALLTFSGSKRRLEEKGSLSSGALLFDDYAHHPTEIKKTLLALRKSYPRAHITCIFQPHTYSRTKKMFEEFCRSFQTANTVIFTDIYPSLREEPDLSVSSKALALKTREYGGEIVYLPTLTDVVKYIAQKKPGRGNIMLTMGAGDVYKIHDMLKNAIVEEE